MSRTRVYHFLKDDIYRKNNLSILVIGMGYPEIAKPQKAWKRERARIQTLLYKCVVAPNISDLKEEDFTLNTVGDDGKVTEMTIRRKMQENC